MVPPNRGRRLGTLPLRALGLGGAVGLDLDRTRALGLRALPLRPLGTHPRRLGLDSWRPHRPPGVRAGAGGLDPHTGRRSIGKHPHHPAGRLVSAGTARGVCALLSQQSQPRPLRQCAARTARPQHRRDRLTPPRGRAPDAFCPSRRTARFQHGPGGCLPSSPPRGAHCPSSGQCTRFSRPSGTGRPALTGTAPHHG